MKDPKMFVGGASRFDIQQGALGDCWLLAAIASLASDEKLMHNVIPPEQKFMGKEYKGEKTAISHFFVNILPIENYFRHAILYPHMHIWDSQKV